MQNLFLIPETKQSLNEDWLFSRSSVGKKRVMLYIENDESENPIAKNNPYGKAFIQMWKRDKKFHKQVKLKRFSSMRPALQ